MKIQVIASGSTGNSYALTFGGQIILLDAGIPHKRIQQALNFKNPATVLITHEHSDHAHKPAINEFLRRGVNVYMTPETIQALNLEPRHNLISALSGNAYDIGECGFEILNAHHDAADPCNFVIWHKN